MARQVERHAAQVGLFVSQRHARRARAFRATEPFAGQQFIHTPSRCMRIEPRGAARPHSSSPPTPTTTANRLKRITISLRFIIGWVLAIEALATLKPIPPLAGLNPGRPRIVSAASGNAGSQIPRMRAHDPISKPPRNIPSLGSFCSQNGGLVWSQQGFSRTGLLPDLPESARNPVSISHHAGAAGVDVSQQRQVPAALGDRGEIRARSQLASGCADSKPVLQTPPEPLLAGSIGQAEIVGNAAGRRQSAAPVVCRLLLGKTL